MFEKAGCFSVKHNWGGSTIFQIYLNNIAYTVTGSQLEENKWYHIAATYSASEKKIKIYLDGSLDQELSIPDNLPGYNIDQNNNVVKSWVAAAGSGTRNMLLDDLVLYSKALTEDEILKLRDNQELLLSLQFEESAGAIAYDQSPNKNDQIMSSGSERVEGKTAQSLKLTRGEYLKSIVTPAPIKKGLTLAGWINITEKGVQMNSWMLSKSSCFSLKHNWGGSTSFTINLGTKQFSVSGSYLAENTWYHITAIYDSKTTIMRLYLNGVEESSLNISELPVSEQPETYELPDSNVNILTNISGDSSNTSREIIYDDLRIYNYTISQDLINSLYNN